MNRLLIALLAGTAATPALAQHGGHQPPPAQSPATDPHAAHQSPPAPQPTPDPHARHHEPPQNPAPDPHAGHPMPAPAQPAADPHAGHQMPGQPQPADPHAGHDTGGHAPAPPAPPVAPPPPGAFTGPEDAADLVFGTQQMRPAREEMYRMHGSMVTRRFRLDRLEIGTSGEGETYAWDADFWIGQPLDRLWIKTEGEGSFGGALEHGEVQALWSHAITPFFDLQAGLRYDFAPDPRRGHLVLGVHGTAPYWLEIDAAAFLSNKGELTARAEVEYDLPVTQRLILQPRVELEFSLQDIPELAIGSGLATAEAGLRLRYEIAPEFAPYVGVQYESAFARTAGFRAAKGEDADGFSLLAGLRIWF